MDSSRFAVVIFTMLVLFMIYLDNAGKLKLAIAAAKGAGAPAPTGSGTSTLKLPTTGTYPYGQTVPPGTPLPTNTDYTIPFMSGAPGEFDMPGSTFGASMSGGWFG